MPLYRDGTVSLTLGSANVIGVGTEFHENAGPGDLLVIGLDLYEVLSVQGDLALTLSGPAKATYSGAAYTLAKGLLSENVLYLMRKIEEFLSDRQRSTGSFDVWVNGVAGGGDGEGRYPLVDRYGVTRMVKSPLQLEADGTNLTGNLQEALDEALLKLEQLGDFNDAVAAVEASAEAAAASQADAATSAGIAHASELASASSSADSAVSAAASLAAQEAAHVSQTVVEADKNAVLFARNEATDARDATLAARDITDGYRAIAVAAGLTATEKAEETYADRLQVATDAAGVNADRAASVAAAAATAQDRAVVAQIVADGTDSIGQQVATGLDQIGTAADVALDGIDTAAGAALTSIATEVGNAQGAAGAADQSRAQAEAAAGTATENAAQTVADAAATAQDRQAVDAARTDAIAAAGTATGAAEQTGTDAQATADDRQAAEAARTDALAAAGTATAQATQAAADAQATASDRAIVLTARGESVQGAVDALASADDAEGHAASAAAILALVQQHGNGWTPTIATVADGERRVHQILGWIGGVGSVPATGYLGPAGLVATAAEATDVRGGRGADGEGTGTANSVNGVMAVEGDIPLGMADIPGLLAALAAAGKVKTVAGVEPGVGGDVPLTAGAVGADAAGTAATAVEALGELLAPVAYTGAMDDVEGLVAALAAKATPADIAAALLAHAEADDPHDQYVKKVAGKALSTNDFTVESLAKLDGIAAGATANSADADLLARGNHTGTQAISTVDGLQAALDSKALSAALGMLADLTTAEKASLVAALNEVNARARRGASEVPAGTTSWDTLTDPGDYIVEVGFTDGPDVSATCLLRVIGQQASALVQRATSIAATPVTFERARVAGVWGAWRRFIVADSAVTLTTLYASESITTQFLLGNTTVLVNVWDATQVEPAMSGSVFLNVYAFRKYVGVFADHANLIFPDTVDLVPGYSSDREIHLKQSSTTAYNVAFYGPITWLTPSGAAPLAPALGKRLGLRFWFVIGQGWLASVLYTT